MKKWIFNNIYNQYIFLRSKVNGLQDLIQQFARSSDKCTTRAIFIFPGSFANDHDLRCGRSPVYHDVPPSPVQLALFTVRPFHKICKKTVVFRSNNAGLGVIKEITPKPVVGIGEASLRVAAMLGRSFSLITTDEHSIPIHKALIRKYSLQDATASVRAPAAERGDLTEKEMYLRTAREAVERDRADVIVLGCAGLSGLDRYLKEELGVPVLDGVVCALFLVEGLARYGVGISKVRRYNPDNLG